MKEGERTGVSESEHHERHFGFESRKEIYQRRERAVRKGKIIHNESVVNGIHSRGRERERDNEKEKVSEVITNQFFENVGSVVLNGPILP